MGDILSLVLKISTTYSNLNLPVYILDSRHFLVVDTITLDLLVLDLLNILTYSALGPAALPENIYTITLHISSFIITVRSMVLDLGC